MRRSTDPIANGGIEGSRPKPAPRTIVSMSLRQVIPWRVGLHQSPPPLHLPGLILMKEKPFEKENSFNGKCSYSCLSHGRGPPHDGVCKNVDGSPAQPGPPLPCELRRRFGTKDHFQHRTEFPSGIGTPTLSYGRVVGRP